MARLNLATENHLHLIEKLLAFHQPQDKDCPQELKQAFKTLEAKQWPFDFFTWYHQALSKGKWREVVPVMDYFFSGKEYFKAEQKQGLCEWLNQLFFQELQQLNRALKNGHTHLVEKLLSYPYPKKFLHRLFEVGEGRLHLLHLALPYPDTFKNICQLPLPMTLCFDLLSQNPSALFDDPQLDPNSLKPFVNALSNNSKQHLLQYLKPPHAQLILSLMEKNEVQKYFPDLLKLYECVNYKKKLIESLKIKLKTWPFENNYMLCDLSHIIDTLKITKNFAAHDPSCDSFYELFKKYS